MPFEGGDGTVGSNALRDYSGNAHDGTPGSGVNWNATAGYDGYGAFELNGVNSEAYIEVGNIMPQDENHLATAYTKTAWVYKAENSGGCRNILSGHHSHAFWVNSSGYLAAGHNPGWDGDVADGQGKLADQTCHFVAVTL